MKVKLRKSRHHRADRTVVAWKEAFPFAVNPRGILTHRVHNVETFYRDGQKTHHHVGYWCQNGCCMDLEGPRAPREVLQETPPKNRLLCVFCEMRAMIAGQRSADKIVGRHVHIGRLKAERVCCQAN